MAAAGEHRFKFIELFAGIGGFRVALEALGGQCVWECERDECAKMAYRANFGAWPYFDVTVADTAKIPSYDVLTGGFPCQDFTNLGEQAGLEGERGGLFFEIIRLARAHRPRLLLLENVRGLVTMNEGGTMRLVVSALEAEGYAVRYGLLNAHALLPQFRNRVYICAFLDAAAAEAFAFPAEPVLVPPPVFAHVVERPGSNAFLGHYVLTRAQWRKVVTSKTTAKHGLASHLLAPGDVAGTLIASYRVSAGSFAQFVPLSGTEKGPGPGRLAEDEARPRAGGARGAGAAGANRWDDAAEGAPEGRPKGAAPEVGEAKPRPRWLTPREAARLMGFPEGFVLHPMEMDAYRMLGNAVCPPVLALVGGLALAAAFGEERGGGCGAPEAELKSLAVGAAAALLVLATPDDERRDELRGRPLSVAEVERPDSAPLCDGLSVRAAIERARPAAASASRLAAHIFDAALAPRRPQPAARSGWPAYLGVEPGARD